MPKTAPAPPINPSTTTAVNSDRREIPKTQQPICFRSSARIISASEEAVPQDGDDRIAT